MWSKAPDYSKSFYKIKKTCQFQQNFSFCLLIVFFVLQYSVPISLVVLGSITSSRDSLTSFVQTVFFPTEDLDANSKLAEIAKHKADVWVTQTIFWLGVITILLGVINTTIRPAENYDTSSKFNNKLVAFEDKLDLGVLELGGLPKDSNAINEKFVIFLCNKRDELTNLINEYNEARSLSPRQANIEAVNQITDDKKGPVHTLSENSNVRNVTDSLPAEDSVTSAKSYNSKALESETKQDITTHVDNNSNGKKPN